MAAQDETDEASSDASSSTQQPPPLTATQRVLGISELLEQILLNVGPLDIITMQRVNRFSRELATTSSLLRKTNMFPAPMMVEDIPRVSNLLQDEVVIAKTYPYHITRVAIESPWTATVHVHIAKDSINLKHARKYKWMIHHSEPPWKRLGKVLSKVEIVPHWVDVRFSFTQSSDAVCVGPLKGGKAAITLSELITMLETALYGD